MTQVSFPGVPTLLGPSNLGYWSNMLRGLLAYEDLEEHIQKVFGCELNGLDVEFGDDIDQIREMISVEKDACREMFDDSEADSWDRTMEHFNSYVSDEHKHFKWQRGQLKVVLIIKTSLEKVWDQLIAAGWDPEMTSAMYHYDFIMREVPKMEAPSVVDSNIEQSIARDSQEKPDIHNPGELVRAMTNIKPSDYSSLYNYQLRLSVLYCQLQCWGVDSLETMVLWIVISHLKEHTTHTTWASHLHERMQAWALTWDDLMQEMMHKAAEE